MTTPAVLTHQLSRHFGAVRAVEDLSLQVETGSIFGFLGPNGAGKTTTIRLLLGLLEPTSGRAEVLGFDTRTQASEIRMRCGALLEHSGLYERLSAAHNLEFYGRVWRIPSPERASRAEELLKHFGLWERRTEIVGTWSRGMKQKLAIARALFHRPTLAFLDEPTAGLDPVAAASLREDLAGLAEREGVTVFLTTHNLMEAEKLCHRVGVIRQGLLMAVGSLDDLRGRQGQPRVEIRGKGASDSALQLLRTQPQVASAQLQNGKLIVRLRQESEIAPLIGLLVGAGMEIEEVHKEKATLEEVFLTLMEEEK